MEKSKLDSENNLAKLELEFFAGHDPELLKAWRRAVVGIAGAGGLGSNIAISLCRAGVGKLIIADFDTVSLTNLNRQQFYWEQAGMLKVEALHANLSRIHSFCDLEIHPARITAENLNALFGTCDILIEAFDLADQKQMLIETWQDLYPERPVIGASGLAGLGRNELIKVVRFDNIYLCGDGISELHEGISPLAPRVAIVANMQANLCLELLAKLP